VEALGLGRLQGKVALVTGAGSSGPGWGTGKAMSVLFAREGARVCLLDVDATRGEETLAIIREEGGEAFVAAADVTDGAGCAAAVDSVVQRYGRLDILVNNAAVVGPTGPVRTLAQDDWERVMRINLTGVMLMSKHALPALADGGGSIVNISSTGALISTGQTPAYGAAKAGVLRLTADLAVAYGRDGVRVNAIAPGNIYTPMVDRGGEMTAEQRSQRARSAPLGTEGTAWDVAYAALFLASDEARWITGACIPVDGGMTQANPSVIHGWLSE
jgi:NAD(P)-dependent dehydrogenase (short-subunit alcohol dehydrogenase family)